MFSRLDWLFWRSTMVWAWERVREGVRGVFCLRKLRKKGCSRMVSWRRENRELKMPCERWGTLRMEVKLVEACEES